MARLSKQALAARRDAPHWQAMIAPAVRPPGYTLNTVVTEWLVLSCRGDWYSLSIAGKGVRVLFFDEADFRRARAHWIPNTPWRRVNASARDGFRHPG